MPEARRFFNQIRVKIVRTLPLACVPKENIYYYATQITHRGANRFYIDTTLCDAPIIDILRPKMPIESILLYHYKTPLIKLNQYIEPNCKLTSNQLGMNKTNAEIEL